MLHCVAGLLVLLPFLASYVGGRQGQVSYTSAIRSLSPPKTRPDTRSYIILLTRRYNILSYTWLYHYHFLYDLTDYSRSVCEYSMFALSVLLSSQNEAV